MAKRVKLKLNEVVAGIAEREQIPLESVTAVFRGMGGYIPEKLAEGYDLDCGDLGRFTTVDRAPRRNVVKGREVHTDGKTVPKFIPSTSWRVIDK